MFKIHLLYCKSCTELLIFNMKEPVLSRNRDSGGNQREEIKMRNSEIVNQKSVSEFMFEMA